MFVFVVVEGGVIVVIDFVGGLCGVFYFSVYCVLKFVVIGFIELVMLEFVVCGI